MASRQRILIVRFSSFGDIVLTTPVIRGLHQQGAEVHYLTKASYAAALAHNPYITQIHRITESVSEVTDDLKAMNFDTVIDLHNNLRSIQLRSALRVKTSAFQKLNIQKWLLVNFKIDTLPPVHIVDRYMKTVAPLGVTYDGQGLDFFVSDKGPYIDLPVQPYVTIAIGAGLPTKALEEDQVQTLLAQLKTEVALLGGPADRTLGERLESRFENVRNYAGKLTLEGSARAIEKSAVLITPDTGLMHIAAALDKPTISVWGNTVPSFGMTPFYAEGSQVPRMICETKGLRCRPCSKIGFQSCPKKHFRCIRDLDLNLIATTANSWVADS